jgi:undecaprenyl diphosphate synthase
VHPPEVGGNDVAVAQHGDGGVDVAARDVELAREVVARSRGHDPEHAACFGGDTGERADRAVTPARDDPSTVRERVPRQRHEVAGVGRQLELEVEPARRKCVEQMGETGAAPPTARRRVHHRGPGLRRPTHRRERSGARYLARVSVPSDLDLHRVPGHVAIVVDGEGRSVGEESLVDVVDGALGIGLRWLTVDVVPSGRWGEPTGELRALLADAERLLLARRDELHARGVRIRVLGRREARLPRRLQRVIDDTEALTAANHGMTLTLAVDHDGRAELAAAMAAIAAEVREGTRRLSSIDEDVVAAHLDAPDLPDPDLLVRTAGDTRTTSFLVWQTAYSEFVFSDTRWSDFRRADLFAAVAEFQRRERRFGAIE